MTTVNVIDDTTNEIVAANVTLEDCFPNDPEGIALAQHDLDTTGFTLVGGGAAPIMRLVRTES